MPRPGPSVTSGADLQPGSDSLFPSGFTGGGAKPSAGSVGTGEIADGSVAAADLNLASVATALAGRSEFTATYGRITAPGLGLSPAPVNAQRIIGSPSVMASPPTVTVSAVNASTSITSSQTFTAPNFAARFLGNPAGVGSSFPDTVCMSSDLIAYNGQVPTTTAAGAWSIEFMHDGSQVEFNLKEVTGAFYRFRVNGQLVTAAATAVPTANPGSFVRVLLDFGGTRTVRRITLEMSASVRINEIRVGPNDTMWASDYAPGPKCVILGDSYTDGTQATSQVTNYTKTFADTMGWQNVRSSGLGGTGYLNNGGGSGKVTFRGRVATDVTAWSPDIVIVQGSINDEGQNAAALTAEANLLFAAIRSANPQMKALISLLPFRPTAANNQAATVAIRDAVKAATGPDLFIDPTAEGWFTGTGRVGTTTGTGNGDLYLYSDGSHPTQAAHDYIGRRLAYKVNAALDSGLLHL